MFGKLFSNPDPHKQIYIYAKSVNSAYKIHDIDMLNAATGLFYTYCYEKGAVHLTKYTKIEEFQCVGQAFAITAIYVDLGNPNAQSIAAENAYYCLARAIKDEDKVAAQWLFNLLVHRPQELVDKFEEAYAKITHLGLKVDQLILNILDMREIIMSTAYYVLSLFYNVTLYQSSIPKAQRLYDDSNAETLVSIITSGVSHDVAISIGKDFYNYVYIESEQTIKNY